MRARPLRTPPARRAVASAALLACAALAGCGGDGDPEPDPSASGSPSQSQSPSPTEEPSATVEPTSGEERTVGSLTLSFPAGWQVRKVTDSVTSATGSDSLVQELSVIAATAYSELPLDEIAAGTRRDVQWEGGPPTREPDLEVDGVDLYHWSGASFLETRGDIVGGVTGGYQVEVILRTDLPRDEHEALLESLLASFSWS